VYTAYHRSQPESVLGLVSAGWWFVDRAMFEMDK